LVSYQGEGREKVWSPAVIGPSVELLGGGVDSMTSYFYFADRKRGSFQYLCLAEKRIRSLTSPCVEKKGGG